MAAAGEPYERPFGPASGPLARQTHCTRIPPQSQNVGRSAKGLGGATHRGRICLPSMSWLGHRMLVFGTRNRHRTSCALAPRAAQRQALDLSFAATRTNPAAPVPNCAEFHQFLFGEKRSGRQRIQIINAVDRTTATAEITLDRLMTSIKA